jgi:hypothetical protein
MRSSASFCESKRQKKTVVHYLLKDTIFSLFHYEQNITKVGYGLDDCGLGIQLLVRAENFSLHHCAHTGSGAHPASYLMDTRGLFPLG